MSGMSLLLAIMVLQFAVHAVGWGMTSAMLRRWRGPEAHFAAHWLALSLGLGLLLLPLPTGHPVRLLANLLLVLAMVLVHRGLARFYRRDPPRRLYLALLLLVVAVQLASLQFDDGTRWRGAIISVALGLALLGLAEMLWRHAHDGGSALAARVMAVTLALLGLVMVWRIVATWNLAASGQMAIDADHRPNLLAGLAMFVSGGLFNLLQIQLALGRYFGRLLHQARHDLLTGLANRRGFMDHLLLEHRRALRGRAGYALLMIDIDHFKQVNDQHGHGVGDRVLAEVAARLMATARNIDTVGRIGGEEFALLLPGTGVEGAGALAQRLCDAVRANPLLADRPGLRVTASVGIACVRSGDAEAEAVLARADEALYRAKAAGRDRVELETPRPELTPA